ncbi:MAG: AAA family ATPase, partial [Desulfuromonadaceae bacterium]|nr:AAA family ATPase [Desulfuromonadaceae bacterium]
MIKDKFPSIKIRRISIRNYKGIDSLELEFPTPRIPGDPDILVMGSRNGLGKTSILECCALLLIGLSSEQYMFDVGRQYSSLDIPDMLIRAGEKRTEISGDIVLGERAITLEMSIDKKGVVKINNPPIELFDELRELRSVQENVLDSFLTTVCGISPNPVLSRQFLFFHSYRKVQEGNPELGMMVERDNMPRRYRSRPGYEFPMSAFKLRMLRSLMGNANLFEIAEDQEPNHIIEKLNDLLKYYTGGTISKLRPSPDNTVDFRVKPINGANSFTFDGLSSGQKEIISTLFLIWFHTQHSPSVVLIDEPELHL